MSSPEKDKYLRGLAEARLAVENAPDPPKEGRDWFEVPRGLDKLRKEQKRDKNKSEAAEAGITGKARNQ